MRHHDGVPLAPRQVGLEDLPSLKLELDRHQTNSILTRMSASTFPSIERGTRRPRSAAADVGVSVARSVIQACSPSALALWMPSRMACFKSPANLLGTPLGLPGPGRGLSLVKDVA